MALAPARPLRFVAEHLEVGVLLGIVGAVQLFPGELPWWLYGFALVSGAFLALQALGLILVYRANGIINFAQVQVGVVAATLFSSLVQYQPILRAFTMVCPGCRVTATLVDVNYWVALVLSMAAAVLLSVATYVFVIKRFARAPRLVLTVATIFLAQLLGGIRAGLPTLLISQDQREAGLPLAAAKPPINWSITLDGARFNTASVLVVAASLVAVVALGVYFRFSRSGVAVRAAGERPERAETVGIKVDAMTGRVWVMAGTLSGIAGLAAAMQSAPPEAALDVPGTVRILAVAVLAGMVSIGLAGIAAVVLGLLTQAVVFSYGTDILLDSVLFVVIAAVLGVQNYRASLGATDREGGWRAVLEIRPVPRELRPLPLVRGWARAGGVLAVLLLLGLPWALSAPQTTTASLVVIYAIAAMSLLVLTGWVGHISLGQFAVAGVAAYVVAVLRLPFLIALPLGALAGALIAVLVGIPALRLRGLYLAVITLAFAVAVPIALLSPRYLGKHLPDNLARPALFGIDLEDGRTFYYVVLVLLALVVAALAGIRRSHAGRVLIATRANPRAAQSLGINLVMARLQGYALSGAVVGLAGALYAFQQHGVRTTAFAPELSITIFIIAVIGGLGSLSGPLIGAVYFGILTVAGASPVVQLLATGGGGLMLLLFVPGGVGQVVFTLRDSLLRRIAERQGISVPSLMGDTGAESDSRPRVSILPKHRRGGGTVFIPPRYRLGGQWAVEMGDGADVTAHARPANRGRDSTGAIRG